MTMATIAAIIPRGVKKHADPYANGSREGETAEIIHAKLSRIKSVGRASGKNEMKARMPRISATIARGFEAGFGACLGGCVDICDMTASFHSLIPATLRPVTTVYEWLTRCFM